MKSIQNDALNIKFRCYNSNRSMADLALMISQRLGASCKQQALSRAMGNAIKTAKDRVILEAADAILKDWEAE